MTSQPNANWLEPDWDTDELRWAVRLLMFWTVVLEMVS